MLNNTFSAPKGLKQKDLQEVFNKLDKPVNYFFRQHINISIYLLQTQVSPINDRRYLLPFTCCSES